MTVLKTIFIQEQGNYMQHDPLVLVEDIIRACKLIIQFTGGLDVAEYCRDIKTKSAVERQFEIIGEALNRIKRLDVDLLSTVSNWREIIAFRNVLAHGYDVVENEIVWDSIKRDIPILQKQLEKLVLNY